MNNIIPKPRNLIRNLNNCIKNFQNSKTITYIPCTIKPNYLLIPRDVNIIEILSTINNDLKEQISLNYYKQLTQREKTRRRIFVDAIKNFIQINRIKDSIIYPSIYLYDILIKNNDTPLSLEKLSLGALILSVKFNYCASYRYSNKKYSYYNFKDYSSEELNEIELTCLSLIDYNFFYINPLVYLELFFINGIVFTTDNIKPEETNFIYKTSLIVLEEIMKINNCYIQYNPLHISCAVIAFSRKKFKLEEWPTFLGKIFKITSNDFKETSDFLNEALKDFKIHDKYYSERNNSIDRVKIYSFRDNSNILKKTFKKIKVGKEEYKDKSVRQNSNVMNYYKKKFDEHNNKRFTVKDSIGKMNNYKYIGNDSTSFIYNEKKIYDYYFRRQELSENKIQIKTIYPYENSKNEDNNYSYKHKYNFHKHFKHRYINNSSMNSNNSEIKESDYEFYKNNFFKNKNKLSSSQDIFNNNKNNSKKYNLNDMNHQKQEEKNLPKERKISSIEHYKKFNISLNNKLSISLSERKVKNLSVVVNRLYSNHNNNIL